MSAPLFLEINTGSGAPQTVTFSHGQQLTDGSSAFELKRAIRSGGNGVVFEADRYEDGRFGGRCAVKMLRRLDAQRVDRFNNEVRVMRSLPSHPHVSGITGAGSLTQGGVEVPWLAMELGGENLRSRVLPVVKGVPKAPNPFAGDDLALASTQICDAVATLHNAGFVHRDIKPDNFVVRRSKKEIVMIDFGLAKQFGEDVSGRPMDDFTRTMEFVGPTFFASPELIEYARNKTQEVGHRSDLFMVGKVMWFIATGTVLTGVPSKAQDPTGGALWGLTMSLIAERPEDRPASADEVRAEIAKW